MIHMKNFQGMGLKTSRRGTRFSEKGTHIRKEHSWKVRGQDESVVGEWSKMRLCKTVVAGKCPAKKSSLLQTK